MNNSKKPSCPKCNSKNTCEIFYGYPADEEEYLKLVAEKKIYPGGCCVDGDLPVWHCNDCENKWGRQDSDDNLDDIDSDNIESFDYDQGFNLNEVYDL